MEALRQDFAILVPGMAVNPEVVGSFAGLVPTNPLVSTNGVVPGWSANRK